MLHQTLALQHYEKIRQIANLKTIVFCLQHPFGKCIYCTMNFMYFIFPVLGFFWETLKQCKNMKSAIKLHLNWTHMVHGRCMLWIRCSELISYIGMCNLVHQVIVCKYTVMLRKNLMEITIQASWSKWKGNQVLFVRPVQEDTFHPLFSACRWLKHFHHTSSDTVFFVMIFSGWLYTFSPFLPNTTWLSVTCRLCIFFAYLGDTLPF